MGETKVVQDRAEVEDFKIGLQAFESGDESGELETAMAMRSDDRIACRPDQVRRPPHPIGVGRFDR